MIRIPSISKQEAGTADLLATFLSDHGVPVHRRKNNVWAFNRYYDPARPTILLNSHHDTVKPNSGYTRDPFSPDIEGDRLYGWQQRCRSQRGLLIGNLSPLLRPQRSEIQPLCGHYRRRGKQRFRWTGIDYPGVGSDRVRHRG